MGRIKNTVFFCWMAVVAIIFWIFWTVYVLLFQTQIPVKEATAVNFEQSTPAKEPEFDPAVRQAVLRAIYACGIRETGITKFGVWLEETTRADVVRQQSRVDSIRQWAAKLSDSVLAKYYDDELDRVQSDIDDANKELTDHAFAHSMAVYDADQSRSRQLKIAVPPCDPAMPLGINQ